MHMDILHSPKPIALCNVTSMNQPIIQIKWLRVRLRDWGGYCNSADDKDNLFNINVSC